MPRWHLFGWGSVIATLLWLAASLAFSFYVARFGGYRAGIFTVILSLVGDWYFFLSPYQTITFALVRAADYVAVVAIVNGLLMPAALRVQQWTLAAGGA